MIAIACFIVELVGMLVMAVWFIGKMRTDSQLNRQSMQSLKETLITLSISSKELTDALKLIDTRLTVVETKLPAA